MRSAMLVLAFHAVCATQLFPADGISIERSESSVVLRHNDKLTATYQLTRPSDSKLSVQSACYFHPFKTPSGITLTDVAPSDHLHHRGIFLAFVEMHGKKDADFWGWGEHAPKDARQIANKKTRGTPSGFIAENEWQAGGEPIVFETLDCRLRASADANVLHLDYTLRAAAPTTLSRWAFSGFCVRMPKAGKLEVRGPDGIPQFPNPSHLKPESDWPDAKWYNYTIRFDDGKVGGIAVVNHPDNPKTLWHNHRDLRMLNPCIVAPEAVTIQPNKPLRLRYLVIAHDGPAKPQVIERLAQW